MTATLSLYLLGPPRIELDGQPLSGLPSRAAEALLFYVACTGRAQARDLLAELLWDDRDQKQASANLRSILSSLRRKLKPFLVVTRQTVALNEQSDFWLDVAAFEGGVHSLDALLEGSEPLTGEQPAALEQVLALYRGDFLEGFYLREGRGFEEWALVQRERLRRLAHTALFRLAQHHLEAGSYAQGIRHAERLLAIDPLDERAHRTAMWLLVRNGQRNAALQQYRRLQELLAAELGVSPAAESAALYERIRRLRTQTRRPALPPVETPLLGRERDLAELEAQLSRPGCRLLTILGPGGVGKTRLLAELGRTLGSDRPGRFLDGIHFVPLAGLSESRHLATALAEALGLSLSGSGRPREELVDYLREKEMLLLLDNFEQLIGEGTGPDGVDLLARLLAEAPLVKMVLTSRRRLHLAEEWLFDLDGLAAPPPEWNQAQAEEWPAAVSYPAVALFLENAQRVDRRFRPAPVDLEVIAAVCRRLDGLPLALSLAATWVRRLPPVAILGQIEDSLDFLETPLRNVPLRHRSLRAVFDHSWRLLLDEERAAVQALSVFHEPFSVVAASDVAGAPAAMLRALADKSFLRRQGPEAVYEMHPLLREFAAEQLAGLPGWRRQVQAAHARYFAGYIERRTPALKGDGQKRALVEIGAVIEEIRAAWEWLLAEGAWEDVARALEGLGHFFWARGWLEAGADLAARTAFALAERAPERRALLAQAKTWQAEFYAWLGWYEEGQVLAEQALALARREQELPALVGALSMLGRLLLWQNQFRRAEAVFAENLRLARRLEDGYWISLALNNQAMVLAAADADHEQAIALFGESLEVAQEAGDHLGMARALVNLGSVLQEQGKYDQARPLYERSLALYREVGYGHGIAVALNYLGQVTYRSGDYGRARSLIQESHDLSREAGNRRAMADSWKQLGNVAREAGDRAEAWSYYEQALRLALKIGSEQLALAVLLEAATLLAVAEEEALAARLLCFLRQRPDAGQELQEAVVAQLARLEDQAQIANEDVSGWTLERAVALTFSR